MNSPADLTREEKRAALRNYWHEFVNTTALGDCPGCTHGSFFPQCAGFGRAVGECATVQEEDYQDD